MKKAIKIALIILLAASMLFVLTGCGEEKVEKNSVTNDQTAEEQKAERDNEEKELREILKNADANLIVFDELHRSGARTWKNVVEQLITSNDKANILGITATPIRDVDHIDMMKELANTVEMILEDVSTRMRDINDESVGMYHGQRRPSELREQLDAYKATFVLFHDQIRAYADQVILTANTMLNE